MIDPQFHSELKTLDGLDRWIAQNPQTDRFGRKYLESRYGALKMLYGERKADALMRELEVASW